MLRVCPYPLSAQCVPPGGKHVRAIGYRKFMPQNASSRLNKNRTKKQQKTAEPVFNPPVCVVYIYIGVYNTGSAVFCSPRTAQVQQTQRVSLGQTTRKSYPQTYPAGFLFRLSIRSSSSSVSSGFMCAFSMQLAQNAPSSHASRRPHPPRSIGQFILGPFCYPFLHPENMRLPPFDYFPASAGRSLRCA